MSTPQTEASSTGSPRSMPGAGIQPGRALWVVIGLALLLRLAFHVVNQQDWSLAGDSWVYHNTARLAADGQGLVSPLHWHTRSELHQAADHPPLFVAVLTLATVFGITDASTQILLNVLLGAATVYLIGLIGAELGGKRLALVAASIAAMYPNLISWNGELLAETLATFLVTLTVLLAYRARGHLTLRRLVVLTAVASLAGLARSESILLLPFLVLPMLLRAHAADRAQLVRALAVSGTTVLALLGPVVIYNMSRFEEPVLISTGFGRSFASGACDQAFYGQFSGFWSLNCLGVNWQGMEGNLDESQTERRYRSSALEYYSSHSSDVPAVMAKRVGRMFHLYRPDQQVLLDQIAESRPWYIAGGGLGSYYLLAVMAMPGALLLRRRRLPAWPLVLPLLLAALGAIIVFGTTRYRASSEGVLVVLAAVGIDGILLPPLRRRLRGMKRRLSEPVLSAALAACMLMVTVGAGMYYVSATDKVRPYPAGGLNLPDQVRLPD